MRIRIINGNTTASVTEKLGSACRKVAQPGTTVEAVTPEMGPASIEGHYDEAVATLGILEEIRRGEADGCDGYVIACFGDPGLLAGREIARAPVIGMAEAAMHMASLIAGSFSIVTTLARTVGISRRLVDAYGMTQFCRSIRATNLAVLDLERPIGHARQRIADECRSAIERDNAEAIVLGCAGMADLASELSQELQVPVIEGVTAAVKLVESLNALQLRTSKVGELAQPLPKPHLGRLARFSPASV